MLPFLPTLFCRFFGARRYYIMLCGLNGCHFFCDMIKYKRMESDKINALNPVTLAYIGDAVFSLFVRTRVLANAEYKSGELNKRVNSFVNAVAQSAMLEKIIPELTDDEKDVVRRGRNCHTPAKAKNTGLMDYKRATALEALFGWLYLTEQTERLNSLQTMCMNINAYNDVKKER